MTSENHIFCGLKEYKKKKHFQTEVLYINDHSKYTQVV